LTRRAIPSRIALTSSSDRPAGLETVFGLTGARPANLAPRGFEVEEVDRLDREQLPAFLIDLGVVLDPQVEEPFAVDESDPSCASPCGRLGVARKTADGGSGPARG
jgi:hypothetical protein